VLLQFLEKNRGFEEANCVFPKVITWLSSLSDAKERSTLLLYFLTTCVRLNEVSEKSLNTLIDLDWVQSDPELMKHIVVYLHRECNHRSKAAEVNFHGATSFSCSLSNLLV
jgi:hypothetical protein